MPESSQNEGRAQERDRDIHMIEIKVKPEQCTSMEEIEKVINSKLRGERVKEFLCTPGDEVVIRLQSEGN
jgi:hypothetical protein